MSLTTASLDALLRDFYTRPGERIKQYVVDMRRDHAWESATCPLSEIGVHTDNTGATCRNEGPTSWSALHEHDCCYDCNEHAADACHRPDVAAWLAEKAARPPIETDRDKYSDDVQPDFTISQHDFYRRVKV